MIFMIGFLVLIIVMLGIDLGVVNKKIMYYLLTHIAVFPVKKIFFHKKRPKKGLIFTM